MRNHSNQDRDEDPGHPGAMAIDPEFQGMRIELFTLCEGALDQDGRLSLVGTYDVLKSSSFPLKVLKMTVAMRLRFWPGEADHYRVRLYLISPDGEPLGTPFEGELTLRPAERERSSAHHLVMNVQEIQFGEAGEYAFDFFLDDEFEGRLPFSIEARAADQ